MGTIQLRKEIWSSSACLIHHCRSISSWKWLKKWMVKPIPDSIRIKSRPTFQEPAVESPGRRRQSVCSAISHCFLLCQKPRMTQDSSRSTQDTTRPPLSCRHLSNMVSTKSSKVHNRASRKSSIPKTHF